MGQKEALLFAIFVKENIGCSNVPWRPIAILAFRALQRRPQKNRGNGW